MIGLDIMYAALFVSLYFEVFMLLAFIQSRMTRVARRIPPIKELADYPTVAIVVPCFNEAKTVAGTIESLLALDYPHDKLEIIVVDDGSTDGTFAVAQHYESERSEGYAAATVRVQQSEYSSRDPKYSEHLIASVNAGEFRGGVPFTPRVKVFHKENGGKHSAMNYALSHTQAHLIGCLDADSIVDSSALKHIAPVFQNPHVAAVTPGILIKKPETMLQHMQNAEYRLSIFNRFTLAFLGSAFITPGPFSIFRANVVRETGGWRHGHSTEDLEMALRIQELGYSIGNAPAAAVYTGTPRTVRALFRQRVRWTYGFLRNAIDYRHMFTNKKYGNLGIIVLPTALLSIAIAIFFFLRVAFYAVIELSHQITRAQILGIMPHFSFNLFYLNTSAMWFLIYVSVALVLVLISVGSLIGTGSRRPPAGTPFFVLFYSFLVPLWLGAAVIRAAFKTGVRWR